MAHRDQQELVLLALLALQDQVERLDHQVHRDQQELAQPVQRELVALQAQPEQASRVPPDPLVLVDHQAQQVLQVVQDHQGRVDQQVLQVRQAPRAHPDQLELESPERQARRDLAALRGQLELQGLLVQPVHLGRRVRAVLQGPQPS